MAHPLPNDKSFGKLMVDLLGKEVDVKRTEPYQPNSDSFFSFSYFIDSVQVKHVVCACDLPLTCSLGGCLTVMPGGMVNDAIKTKNVPDMIIENMKEVLNIVASLVNEKDSPHLKLGNTQLVKAPTPPLVSGLLNRPGDRADFKVQVPGYSGGLITFRWIGP